MAINKDGSRASGKGGEFVSKPNVFGQRPAGRAPAFADHTDCGLALDVVIHAGHALIIGSTRDGGALCITVLEGDTRHRTYCATTEELGDALARLREFFA